MHDLRQHGYELIDRLGEGGTGTVYRAHQLSLDRLVAVKILPRQAAEQGDSIQRFLIEARIAASLKHPNIVQVYEAGFCDGHHFFVMELVTGYSVADWLQRKGNIAEEDALLVVQYIADALDYAWRTAAILHGDVKPANIMVDGDGAIKLADFLALTPPGGIERPESLRSNIVGTPNYMSPEQTLGREKLDFHTDIYSLGAVLYHLVTGCMPFEEADTTEATMLSQVEDTLADPAELNPGLSPGCAWLIEKMMIKNAADRYASWSDVREDIHRVKHGGFPATPLPEPGSSTVRRCAARERKRVVRLPSRDDSSHAPSVSGQARKHRRTGLLTGLALLLLLAGGVSGGLYKYRVPLHRLWSRLQTVLVEWEDEQPGLVPPLPLPTSTPAPLPTAAPTPRPPPSPHPAPGQPAPFIGDEEDFDVDVREEPESHAYLKAYWDLFEEVVPLLRIRNLEAATDLLAHAENDQADERTAARCARDLERIRRIQALLLLPLTHKENLRGYALQDGAGTSGIVQNVQGEMLHLRRDAGLAAQAMFSVPIASLSDEAFLQLIVAADPAQSALHQAIWHISRFHFDQATRQAFSIPTEIERDYLLEWIEDWNQNQNNLRAREALKTIRAQLVAGQVAEARQAAGKALEQYRETEAFSLVYQVERDELRYQLQNPPAPVRQPDALPPGTPPTPPAADPGPPPPNAREARTRPQPLTPNGVHEKIFQLDGEIIRLQFQNRGVIREIGPDLFAVDLGGDDGRIVATFPRNGLRWMQRQPQGGRGQPRKSVFAIVQRTGQPPVRLLGRREKQSIGDTAIEFEW